MELENRVKTDQKPEEQGHLIDRKISVAPMMDWTDRHCRYFLRGFAPSVLLYTEMITAAAILRGNRDRLLRFDPEEHPVALQLGGSDAKELAAAAAAGEAVGYDEINLNCGCPSDRVASGAFGACLMLEPQRVAECVAAIRTRVKVPVTVKMRIGVVDSRKGQDGVLPTQVQGAAPEHYTPADFDTLCHFVRAVSEAGSEVAIVHARKAVLGRLTPKENREIPPLRYDVVRRVKETFPKLPLIVNGGFRNASAALEVLTWCDGVMLGREAYHRPYVLTEIDQAVSGRRTAAPSREALLERMARYAQRELRQGERLSAITRHMLGLYAGEPGARDYRRHLSEGSRSPQADADLLRQAAKLAAGVGTGPRTGSTRSGY